jgi:tetratricopeptide (TPR) repeat protein
MFAGLLIAGLLLALNADVLGWPFVSDDFVFLAASRQLTQLFTSFDVYSNYFRPIGREAYFYVGHLLAGDHPLPFHLVNFAILLAIIALTVRLGARLGGPRTGLLAGAVYTLLYSNRMLMAWVSCSQDLLAACFALLAAHALLGGRRWHAGFWQLAALLSKESVAAFPLVYALWRCAAAPPGTTWRRRIRTAGRESAPLWVASVAWGVVVIAVRIARHAWAKHGSALADVSLSVGSLWEGMRSAILSYVALEQPWGAIAKALVHARQAWFPLAAGIVGALLMAALSRRLARPDGTRWARDPMLLLGVLWAVVGAVPVALAGHHFSAYYITFSGVGFALFAGRLLGMAQPMIVGLLLGVSAVIGFAANRVDLFNFARLDPVPGVSYITIARLDLERVFLDSMQVALVRVQPPRDGVVYVSHAPHYMSFVTMYGRAPRIWLEDPSFDLEMIGQYRPGASARPHAFLRFDGAPRSFLRIPNEVMDEDLEAETAMQAQRPEEARRHLERALGLIHPGMLVPVKLDLLDDLGFACSVLGDTARARASWREALALDPAFSAAALNLARFEATAGRLAAARDALLRLLLSAPDATDAWTMLVQLQQELGDVAGTRAALEGLERLDPTLAAELRAGRPAGQPTH